MELSKKDNRLLQMKYPAPYSQSWASMGHQRRSNIADKNHSKNISAMNTISKKYSGRGAVSPRNVEPSQRFTGLDPTVPHLKYGLFPKKLYITRGQSRILTVKPSVYAPSQADVSRRGHNMNTPKMPRCIVEPKRLKTERPAIAKASTIQKFLPHSQREQGETSECPVFVFRPLEHRNLRSLTVSASTHLDIKPKPARSPILPPQHYKMYK